MTGERAEEAASGNSRKKIISRRKKRVNNIKGSGEVKQYEDSHKARKVPGFGKREFMSDLG